MWIVHTKEVSLSHEVTGVEQVLTQQIFGTVEEAYLADIRNRTTNSINYTVSSVLMHLQDNYGQLMPYDLLEREDTVKKTNYNPHDPITTMLSAVKEILELSDTTRTTYTQMQAFNITYVIIHRTVNFGLSICE